MSDAMYEGTAWWMSCARMRSARTALRESPATRPSIERPVSSTCSGPLRQRGVQSAISPIDTCNPASWVDTFPWRRMLRSLSTMQ